MGYCHSKVRHPTFSPDWPLGRSWRKASSGALNGCRSGKNKPNLAGVPAYHLQQARVWRAANPRAWEVTSGMTTNPAVRFSDRVQK